MSQQLPPEVLNLIDSALTEDQAFNDPTTHSLVPDSIVGSGMLRAKADGVPGRRTRGVCRVPPHRPGPGRRAPA